MQLEPYTASAAPPQKKLKPFSGQLQKLMIYLLHAEQAPGLAPWAVGRFDVDNKSAFMFFDDFLGAANGGLLLNLMQTSAASTDMIMSVIPVRIEPGNLVFAAADYDLGIHNRIG